MALNYEVIHGLDFTNDEIKSSLRKKGLLSLELEFSRRCNLRCLYCYSSADAAPLENELTIGEIKSVIDQAVELGAKKIILLGGGEPLLYEGLSEVVEYIHKKKLEQTMFTNGTLMTGKFARFLYRHDVSVVVKRNSFDPKVQDSLAGVDGACRKMQGAIKYLMKAGYPNGDKQLGIQSVILKNNLREIPDMWVWARERNITPYFEILTMQGRARMHREIEVDTDDIRELFARLREIDVKRFGNIWLAHPTIASFSCKRHLYSCLVNSQGYVQPCTGVDIFVGNVREKSLAGIIKNSHVIQELRKVHTKIEGACKECELNCECYGCRGNAYQMTGNYLAADPKCWLNSQEKQKPFLKQVSENPG